MKLLPAATLLCLLASCAPAPESFTPEPAEFSPQALQTTNYTPFESVIGNGVTDGGAPFAGLAVKATLTEAKDGESRLSGRQRSFAPQGSVIDELPAFRKQGEIYIVTSGQPVSAGALFLNDLKIPLGKSEWILKDRAYGLVALAPYLTAGDTVTVSSPGLSVSFAIPALFSPFVLARYESGAMMPTPMRADTIVIDIDTRELTLVYRATLPTEPPLRAVDFRLIVEPTDPWPGNTLAATKEKFIAQQRYLLACPVPSTPIEPCAVPNHLPARDFFE